MEKILIVEDDEVVRIIIKKCLDHRFNIDEAVDGDIALRLILEIEYDLIITDIGMPNMNGTSLARTTHQVFPKLPFIVISTITSDYTTFKSEYPNIKAWIQKPFKPSLLIGMVDGVFGGHLD